MLRRTVLVTRTVLGTAGLGTRGFFQIIPQWVEAFRFSFGRNPKKIDPGLRLDIPIYHSTVMFDMREQSVTVAKLHCFTSDNIPVLVSGSLFFQITNSHDACFNIQDITGNISNIGTSGIRSVIGLFQYDTIISDRNLINSKLQEVIGKSIEKWGCTCTRFEIQQFGPSNREIEKQLELQMEGERLRRKTILDTEAAVNIAEGNKKKAILESEGALTAARNSADGKRYALQAESAGLADQLEVIAVKLGDPHVASRFLLRMKEIEQLKAIASGDNNAVYFLGKTNMPEYPVHILEQLKK